jgi:hypothetical protein
MDTQFTEIRKTLRSSWKAAWGGEETFPKLEAAMNAALNAIVKLGEEKSQLQSSGRLSVKGLRDEVRAMARSNTVGPLHRAAHAVEAVKADMAQRRKICETPNVRPEDTAGTVLRGEMRAWLRTLGPGQLVATLLDEEADGRLVLAALEAPPGMSGLTAQMQAQVRERNVARTHGPELQKLEQLEDACTLVEAAITTSLYQLRQEADFPENNLAEFDIWMDSATTEIERALEDKSQTKAPNGSGDISPSAPTAALQAFTDEIDRIFAGALPKLYPNHPVNQTKNGGAVD